MVSSYDQFVNSFKTHLHKVAEFDDGEESSTMGVIIDSFIEAGLKDLLDKYDQLRANQQVPEDNEKKTKRSSVKKTTKASKTKDDDDNGEEKVVKKKKQTGYNAFLSEKVKKEKMHMREVAALWQSMNDEEKQKYHDIAATNNAAA